MFHPGAALDKIAPGGRLGLIALATDFNSEQEFRQWLPADVQVFTNRVTNANPLTLENLQNMANDISRAAAGILPGLALDAMIYGCTSGTLAIGIENIEKQIHRSCPGIAVTNPVSAVLAALEHRQARRISILTPYIEEVNREMVSTFGALGIEVINILGLGYDNDIDISCISPRVIYEYALKACDHDADLLFISCTALRTAGVIADIEQSLGKTVISSNQALIWHSLRLIGYPHAITAPGSLFVNTR